MKPLALAGQKFGRLTVIEIIGQNSRTKRIWRCVCECGNETTVITEALRSGNTQSCGCYQHDRTSLRLHTHGEAGFGAPETQLHRAWRAMKRRCAVRKSYIARHITVCPRWQAYVAFRDDILATIGPRPSKDYSIDRVDNDRGYEPENVRWATALQQAHNSTRWQFKAEQAA